MTTRLLWRFLVDRSGLILAFLLNTALILTVILLVASYEESPVTRLSREIGYTLVISFVLLLVYLAIDLARWWPFASQVESMLSEGAPLESLAHLPPAGNADQAMAARLATRMDSLWSTERLRLVQEYERQTTFANLWVHQMKTPVAAISVLAQESAQQALEELRPTIASIEEEAMEVADGLELVLNMARLREFAQDYLVRRVNLLETIREIINHRKKQFIRTGIFPEVDAVDADDWTVLSDQKWNRFLLEQIVANALKYASQTGAERQRLRFELRRSGTTVILRIVDQGPGIPPEDLPRIYEPFFTGENGRRFGGATGIGLYLVRQVVDRLGHRLVITSAAGSGTTAELTYEVAPADQGG